MVHFISHVLSHVCMLAKIKCMHAGHARETIHLPCVLPLEAHAYNVNGAHVSGSCLRWSANVV